MESISVFEMIKVGIGPSSSHTMGPWTASLLFLDKIKGEASLAELEKIEVTLYGSLALTGKGHGTDIAVIMGLTGQDFKTVDTSTLLDQVERIKENKIISSIDDHRFLFDPLRDIKYRKDEKLPFHANGMIYKAKLMDDREIVQTYYSIGGGFVTDEAYLEEDPKNIITPYPCHKAKDIENYCEQLSMGVSQLVFVNEKTWRSEEEIKAHSLYLWEEIKACIYKGIHQEGFLPGDLGVRRRASALNQRLLQDRTYSNFDEWVNAVRSTTQSYNNINKWISCFALAVNEENASFGRIITAPTNGAAGVIPAVLMYAYIFENIDEAQIIRFILTAGEIGTLFKKNATISAAMGGCQAEIGVSSSMAAGGLTECLGGDPGQVLMASEIAMEHHLGLTCDPIGGLVQVPCIERNSMGAIKAITASNLALEGDPKSAKVSLDAVIDTMWQTAKDMHSKYKETSEGGLAVNIPVNVVEC